MTRYEQEIRSLIEDEPVPDLATVLRAEGASPSPLLDPPGILEDPDPGVGVKTLGWALQKLAQVPDSQRAFAAHAALARDAEGLLLEEDRRRLIRQMWARRSVGIGGGGADGLTAWFHLG